MPKRIAIVGAGLRGLASAAFLKSAGADVRVFEKAPRIGGIWQQVLGDVEINTPSYGYTFHETNIWQGHRPTKIEILSNLERMIAHADLKDSIALSTPIERVFKTDDKTWTLNDRPEEFDGILVCPGFLGSPRRPVLDLVADFAGDVLLPYAFDPKSTAGKNIAIVGSGSSALDMLAAVHGAGCKRATLFIRPEVEIRDIGRLDFLLHAISSNPLIYKLTKKPGGTPAAVRAGINAVMNAKNVDVARYSLLRASDRQIHTSKGHAYPADVIVWCTGWEPPRVDWITRFENDPTLVVAACKRCLDAAGFGFGAASAHAKALLATVECGLPQRFTSGSRYCDCDQDHYGFSRHILLNLALYYIAQPDRWRLLRTGLSKGIISNRARFHSANEPKWASVLAFFNAPFGF